MYVRVWVLLLFSYFHLLPPLLFLLPQNMSDDGEEFNFSDASDDPALTSFILPDVEGTTIYDLRTVSGILTVPLISQTLLRLSKLSTHRIKQ